MISPEPRLAAAAGYTALGIMGIGFVVVAVVVITRTRRAALAPQR